jgi:D-threo-aldose 1-dehydrogenase
LQFSLAPDVAVALVVGCSNRQQVLDDFTATQTKIPAGFWSELRSEGLIESDAPVPKAVS